MGSKPMLAATVDAKKNLFMGSTPGFERPEQSRDTREPFKVFLRKKLLAT